MNGERDDRREAELARLFERARRTPPDISGVEHGFETRVMARIREWRERRDPWYAAAWRLVPVFLTVAALLWGWTVLSPPGPPAEPGSALGAATQEVALLDALAGE